MKITMNQATKIVIIDNGALMFRSIFGWERNKTIPATYSYLNMLIANLKRLDMSPDDIVIIAVDSPKGSWRKDIDKDYKANRREAREKHKEINWQHMFDSFGKLLECLKVATPFHVLNIDKLEADDIMAYACQYFKDCEIILVTFDSDMEQLVHYKNVKIFSPLTKKFKIIKNPYAILAKKVSVEKSDNLISPILNEADYARRHLLVNLLDLPEVVKNKIKSEFDKLELNKIFNIKLLPFNKMPEKFLEIYNNPIPIEKEKKKKKKSIQTTLL